MTSAAPEMTPHRPVIELECGITVYPSRCERARWRAVWYEDGQRQQCAAVSEDRLAAKLEKVRLRLESNAPNTYELRAKFEQDPIVRGIIERFGGRISEVRSRGEE